MSAMTAAIAVEEMIPEFRLSRRGMAADFSPGSTAVPSTTCSDRHFERDTMLFREGGAVSSVYVIRNGVVKLVRHLTNGRARIVGLRGPGSVLGIPVVAPGSTVAWTHSAIALNAVDVLCWPASHLRRLREVRPERYIDLLESLHEQTRQADLWIAEFSTGRIRSRVVRLILYLERMQDGLEDGEVELLTCQDMGEVLGVTPESVSRIVAELKRDEILRPVTAEKGERFHCDRPVLRELGRD